MLLDAHVLEHVSWRMSRLCGTPNVSVNWKRGIVQFGIVTGTQGAVTDSLPGLWQEYEFVNSMTKVIKEKQGPAPLPLPDRSEKFEPFEKWLAEYGAKYADQVEMNKVHVRMCVCIERERKRCF